MANNKISFKRGLKSQYDATTKDEDTLYFVKENVDSQEGELYLGDILITKHIYGASFNRNTKKLTLTFNNNTSTEVNLTDVMVTATATADNIATFDASGQVKDSQKTIGGGTLGPTPDENTLATEKAVENAINTSLSSVYTVRGSKTPDYINALTSNQVKIGDVYDVSEHGGIISDQSVEVGDNVVCISTNGGTGGVPKWDKLAASIDLSNYIQKVASPTQGDIAILDSVGDIVDSSYHIISNPSPVTPSSSAVPTESVVNAMISTAGDTKYVRYDTDNQNLNPTQQANARTNIDVIQKIQNAIGDKLVISTSGGEISEGYSVESSQTTGADNTKIPTIGKVNDMVQNASVQWEQLES